mgnify:CR=1 FL=1
MKVLLACEESQIVTKAFRDKGHEAYSCDIIEQSGGYPEWHIKDDVMEHLEDGWDMMIAFPPCTHLAVSGAKHFKKKREDGRQQKAIDFFLKLANAPIVKIALENPVSIMSTIWRKPDQIIQPWQFGDPFQKTTCLWLKNLPILFPTKIVDKGAFVTTPSGKKLPKWYSDNKNSKVRSTTFQGIAEAMAEQWGKNT